MQYDEATAKAALYTLLDEVEALYDVGLNTRDQRGELPVFGYLLGERVLILGVGPNIASFFSPEFTKQLTVSPLDDISQARLFVALESDRARQQHDEQALAFHDLYTAYLATLDNQGYKFMLLHPTPVNLPPTLIATHTDREPPLVMVRCEHRPRPKEPADANATHSRTAS